jgi:LysM repeat protein
METYWVLRDGTIECLVAAGNPGTVVAGGRVDRTGMGANQKGATPATSRGLRGLRLTRRGRTWLAGVSLALVAPLVSAGAVAAASSPLDAPQLTTYTVAAGESLWTIAERSKVAGTDTRDQVTHLKRLNHLSTSSLYAGQVIMIEAGE